MNGNINKKYLIISIGVIIAIILLINVYSRFIFYKSAFNSAVHEKLFELKSYSMSFTKISGKVVNDRNAKIEDLIALKSEYDVILRDLSKLEFYYYRETEEDIIRNDKYFDLGGSLNSMRLRAIEQENRELKLTEEDINNLIRVKKVIASLGETIDKGFNDVSYSDPWGGKDMLRDKAWLNILREITKNLNEFEN